jgi:hypothetical protein
MTTKVVLTVLILSSVIAYSVCKIAGKSDKLKEENLDEEQHNNTQ